MKFTESKFEKAFTELLEQQGYPHYFGNSIVRNPNEVLIEDDLASFLMAQYAHEGITVDEVQSFFN
ncbi:MAG: hypothetical protein GX297_09440 [Treponema sp.]|jgi:type I restriction enzyme R subunit|nr:hypothetical protein [Treponema sp.]